MLVLVFFIDGCVQSGLGAMATSATPQDMLVADNTGGECDTGSALVPSVQHLIGLDAVKVHQKSSSFSGNKYTVLSGGDVLFSLKEDGHAFTFLSEAESRRFRMDGLDNMDRKVLVLHRPAVLLCSDSKLMLYMDGNLVSIIHEEITFMKAVFLIQDANGSTVLRVKGGYSHYNFQLQTPCKREIGKIQKQFGGFWRGVFTRLSDYVISFPTDLDVRFKMAAVAACILIDYRYHGS